MNECDYERFLRSALTPLLTHPEHLMIDIERGVRSHRINVQVHGEDKAFVIGREAQMVKSIQTILNHMAQRKGEAVQLGVLEPQVGSRAAWRDFEPDNAWDVEKDKCLVRMLRPMLEAVFDQPLIVTTLMVNQKTEFLLNVDTPIEMRLLSALKTVIRSIGKAMRREVEFQARLVES